MKVGALDQAVKEARRENAGTKGQGRAFELPTIGRGPTRLMAPSC